MDILEPSIDDEDFFVVLDEVVPLIDFCGDGALGFFFDFVEEGFFPFGQVANDLVGEKELGFDFGFGVVELGRFLFDGVGDG